MSITKETAVVVSQKEIGKDIFDMVLSFPKGAKEARPGQFLAMYCNDATKLLPRPISICGIDAEAGTLRVVYRIAGEGTREFSKMKQGDTLEVMGPLGNGFTMKEGKAILVGGGIGIPPMLELAKQLSAEKTVVLGYRDELFLKRLPKWLLQPRMEALVQREPSLMPSGKMQLTEILSMPAVRCRC